MLSNFFLKTKSNKIFSGILHLRIFFVFSLTRLNKHFFFFNSFFFFHALKYFKLFFNQNSQVELAHIFFLKKNLIRVFEFKSSSNFSAKARILSLKRYKINKSVIFKKFFFFFFYSVTRKKKKADFFYEQSFYFQRYLHGVLQTCKRAAKFSAVNFKKAMPTLIFLVKKKTFCVFFFNQYREQLLLSTAYRSGASSNRLDFIQNSLFFLANFFKLKNFFFLNNFFFFLSFFPAELLLFFFKKSDLAKLKLNLNFFFEKKFNIWQLFFLQSSRLLEKKSFFLTFFYTFLTRFLEARMRMRVSIVMHNCLFNLKKISSLVLWVNKRADLRFKAFNRFFFFNEFLDVLLLSFLKKDIVLFEAWLTRFLRKLHFKLHKNFLFLCSKFLKRFFKVFKLYFSIKGLKIDFRGKVSVSGNAKKRHFLIHFGKTSFSKKINRISYAHNTVSTKTGVCGLMLLLVY